MKTEYIILEESKKRSIEIFDILKAMGSLYAKRLSWVIFDVTSLGALSDIKTVQNLESKKSTIKIIRGDKFIKIMQNIQTDWAVCFAFKSHEELSFTKEPSSNPQETYTPQSDSAEIEIRSFDGTKIFVFSKNVEIIEKINNELEGFVIKRGKT